MKQVNWLIIFIFFGCCLSATSHAKKKKAVFIIADGIPADVIERIQTPTLDEIAKKGGYTRAYVGGEAGGITETPTISAVCYNNLLTATWVNKHNVWGNGIEAPNYNYWSIFRIAENQKKDVKTAIFSSWEDNRTKLVGEGKPEAGNIKIDYVLDGLELDKKAYPDEKHSLNIFKIDEKISSAAAECIKTNAPDMMWVYLWFMDCAGHEFGDSPFFDKYTALTDKQIARIWEAIKYREANFDEEWMIVVTTDHGRTASNGKGHGGQSERERTTWIYTNVQPNTYFKQQQPGIIDIAPSVCRYMNFSIPQEIQYEQEGMPFIGKVDLSNVKAQVNGKQIILTWESYSNSPVQIYAATTNNFKEGKLDGWKKVGKAKAGEKKFVFDTSAMESSFYKFSLRGKNNMQTVWVKK
ncbi:alkaline phosphatase family protein [Parabacteroides pacaensis]|uniref:alkaline phosphatase family protein n=1 Tax=Parabacteroides pacaensis TaxID=2086575 RepID=UPI000D0FC27F|nr:alkaline phosphatase family protein [Parabacteroides pacaensis]